MLAKACAALAIVGSAAAYVPPMMSLSANRREAIAGAGAAAVVAPLLRPTGAEAKDLKLKAPVITIFDNRGCDSSRNPSRESTARKTGTGDDDMCVKVIFKTISYSEAAAASLKEEFVSFKEKGIDGDVIGKFPKI